MEDSNKTDCWTRRPGGESCKEGKKLNAKFPTGTTAIIPVHIMRTKFSKEAIMISMLEMR